MTKKEIILASTPDLDDLIRLLYELFTQDLEFVPDYEKQKKDLKK